jgi:hypothetical protein
MGRLLRRIGDWFSLRWADHLWQLGEEKENTAVLALEDATEYKTRAGRIRKAIIERGAS